MARRSANTIPLSAEQLEAMALQLDALAGLLRDKAETIGEHGTIRMIDEGLASFVMMGCDDLAKAVANSQTVPNQPQLVEEVEHRSKPRRTRKGKR